MGGETQLAYKYILRRLADKGAQPLEQRRLLEEDKGLIVDWSRGIGQGESKQVGEPKNPES
jgi:hypothetical protein